MRYLLLIAHGSRRQACNDEIRAVGQQLAVETSGRFDGVRVAFLELAEPDIEQGLDQCITAGASEVLVLPYFLCAGRHVTEDIPAVLAAKRTQYPQVAIRLLEHLGASPQLPGVLRAMAEQG